MTERDQASKEIALVMQWANSVKPTCCALAGGLLTVSEPSAFEAEENLICTSSNRRQLEFRCGRYFARQALSNLGIEPSQITSKSTKEPKWPEGVLGSISHCKDAVLTLVCLSKDLEGVGIDIEDITCLETGLLEIVCRAEETASCYDLDARGMAGTLLYFVAKEAYYKAIFPKLQRYVEFKEVMVRFNVEENTFCAELIPSDAPCDRFILSKGHFWYGTSMVAALCVVEFMYTSRQYPLQK